MSFIAVDIPTLFTFPATVRRLRNIGNTRGMIEDIQTLRASEQCLEQESIIFEELPDEEDS